MNDAGPAKQFGRFAGPIVCAMAFVVMFAWTYRTWPDPVVDFGREVYLPWRITEGEGLYRDLAHFSGPVSPTFNAVLFKLFGTSLSTIFFANTLIFAGICALLYRFVSRCCDHLTAAVGTLGVITLCGFAKLVTNGNFNFIAPYSHELTHAIALGLVAMTLVVESDGKPGRIRFAAAGVALGIQFMTKPEVALATWAAVFIAIALRRGESSRGRLVSVATLAGCAIVPPALATLLLAIGMPTKTAFAGVLGAWKHLGDDRITSLPFYKQVLGVDNVSRNLTMIVERLVMFAAPLAALALFARKFPAVELRLVGQCVVVAAIALVGGFFVSGDGVVRLWGFLPLGWTVFVPLSSAVAIAIAFKGRSIRAAAFAVFGVFAWLMMLKIALRVSFQHYGFALAMPAFVFVAMTIVYAVPAWLRSAGGSHAWFRSIAIGVLAAMTIGHLRLINERLGETRREIVVGGERLFTTIRGLPFQDVVRFLESHAAPDSTIAAVPEGALVNFVLRRENPTGFCVTMPVEILMFGEGRVLAAFEESPPDFLVVRPTSMAFEYGTEGFDYMPRVRDFIDANYDTVFASPAESPFLEVKKRRSNQ